QTWSLFAYTTLFRSNYGTSRVKRAVFAAAVPPYLYNTEDNPDGPMDDAGIADFESGVKKDRIAFLEDFTKTFFAGAQSDLVSEPFRLYNRDIAAGASPKGTLDCIGAFGRTDFREDLAKFNISTLVIHRAS